ncbi:MAG: hypothetical protein AB2602_05060, partial [Candidatus Thiodiazotropha sp.]
MEILHYTVHSWLAEPYGYTNNDGNEKDCNGYDRFLHFYSERPHNRRDEGASDAEGVELMFLLDGCLLHT